MNWSKVSGRLKRASLFIDFARFFFSVLLDMSEQLLTGLGFALLVGGTAFQTWVVLFAGFAFFVLLSLMKRTLTISLDFDWFYRKSIPGLTSKLVKAYNSMSSPVGVFLRNIIQKRFDHLFAVHGPQGIFARTSPSASMVLWVAVLLATSMVLYYVKA